MCRTALHNPENLYFFASSGSRYRIRLVAYAASYSYVVAEHQQKGGKEKIHRHACNDHFQSYSYRLGRKTFRLLAMLAFFSVYFHKATERYQIYRIYRLAFFDSP